MGLSLDTICCWPQLPEMVEFCRAVPEVTIIINHLGGLNRTGPFARLGSMIFPPSVKTSSPAAARRRGFVFRGSSASKNTLNGSLHGIAPVFVSFDFRLAKGAVKTGTMGTEKAISAVRDYVAAFLDVHLQEKNFDPLLSGSSLRYPDAFVVTQEKLLCSQGAQRSSQTSKSR